MCITQCIGWVQKAIQHRQNVCKHLLHYRSIQFSYRSRGMHAIPPLMVYHP